MHKFWACTWTFLWRKNHVCSSRAPCRYIYICELHVLLGKCKSLIFFLTRLEDWRVRFLQSPLLDPTVEAEVVFRIQWEARGRRRLHQFDSIRNSIRIRNSKRTKNTCSLILSIATGTGVIKKIIQKISNTHIPVSLCCSNS